jgi:hypothetical protein
MEMTSPLFLVAARQTARDIRNPLSDLLLLQSRSTRGRSRVFSYQCYQCGSVVKIGEAKLPHQSAKVAADEPLAVALHPGFSYGHVMLSIVGGFDVGEVGDEGRIGSNRHNAEL